MVPDMTKEEIRDELEEIDEYYDCDELDPDERPVRSAIGRPTTMAPAKTNLYRPPRCD